MKNVKKDTKCKLYLQKYFCAMTRPPFCVVKHGEKKLAFRIRRYLRAFRPLRYKMYAFLRAPRCLGGRMYAFS